MTSPNQGPTKNRPGAGETKLAKRDLVSNIRLWAMPVLLAGIALVHLARVRSCHQTPWKGGGFGMFSTIDKPSSRYFRCTLMTPDGSFPVAVPASSHKLAQRLKIAPSQDNLKSFAHRLLTTAWQQEAGSLNPILNKDPLNNNHPQRGERVRVTGVRVEIWRLKMMPGSRRLTGELLDKVTVNL